MNKLNEEFAILVKKLNRILYYIGRFEGESDHYRGTQDRLKSVAEEVTSLLECEGVKPSHDNLFFLYSLYNVDGEISNNTFVKQYLRWRRDDIHEIIENMMAINDISSNGGDTYGASPQIAADVQS